jgi:hypothetical protein
MQEMHMKSAGLAHAGLKSGTNALGRVPRGWIVLGAASMSWAIFVAIGAAGTQLFTMIASHL